MQTYRIESILGGEKKSLYIREKGQFYDSSGIDPGYNTSNLSQTGMLFPVGVCQVDNSTIAQTPLWMETTPKDQFIYVYGGAGSLYTLGPSLTGAGFTSLADGGCLSSSTGNGIAYYDNYIYLAKNTDVARYGPLNGAPVFDGSYWDTTLAKSAMTDTQYPHELYTSIEYPNHYMHRHSDGALYICDVQANKGVLHKIKTTYGAVEGDTNDGSTESALDFGYGLYPTCLESFGPELVIGLWEGKHDTEIGVQKKAKIAFWDTTSDFYNKLIYFEFPDEYISSIKNVNGVLYVFSGNVEGQGHRVTRFIGNYSFETVALNGVDGSAPMPGSVQAVGNRVFYGVTNKAEIDDGAVFSIGLEGDMGSGNVFTPARIYYTATTHYLASIYVSQNRNASPIIGQDRIVMGWTDGGVGVTHFGIDVTPVYGGNTQDNGEGALNTFRTGEIMVGRPFQVTEVRIPALNLSADKNMVYVYLSLDNSTNDIGVIDYYSDSSKFQKFVTGGMRGEYSFGLELQWVPQTHAGATNTYGTIVGLPIEIDFEYV